MAIIYLLSGGDKIKGMFGKEIEHQLKEDLKGKNILVSIGARREFEKNDTYFYGDESMLGVEKTFGFSDLKEFYMIDGRTPKEDGLKLLEKADIIYLQGGDPFIQKNYIRDNGYKDFLENYNGIILGLSAGSMNLGKKSFYSKDDDYPKTIIYDGLGLIDITIDPHFDVSDKSRVKEALLYSKKMPIVGLPDYSMIKIENNKVTNVGVHYLFLNGRMEILNNDEIFDIYTRDGEHLGTKEKSICHSNNPGFYHKPVWVWIINSDGQVLVQKRAETKKKYPNYWDMPSAGHVQAGESSIMGAIRETEEELGIKTKEVDYLYIGEFIADKSWEIAQIYLLKLDLNIKDMHLQEKEVAEVKWLSMAEFKNLFYSDLFVPFDNEYKNMVINFLKNNINSK